MSSPYSYLPDHHFDYDFGDDDFKTRSAYTALVDRSDPHLQQLRTANPWVSLHDHPFRYPSPLNTESWARSRVDRRLVFGYEGFAQSGMSATVACTNSWAIAEEAHALLTRLRADIHHQPDFYVAESAEDILRESERANRRIAVFLGLEAMTPFADDLDAVERLFGLGVRVCGLAYSEGNILGSGLGQKNDEGLTSVGRAFVKQMNAVGMAIDLSHVGDRTTLDVIAYSERPVLISHAGARGVWPISRLKPDAVLRALAEAEGVIGIEAAPNTTCCPERPSHDIDAVMRHVEYVVELVGIDAVAFGPDLLYGKHSDLHALRGHVPAQLDPNVAVAEFADGVENPTEAFWNLTHWMIDHGWTDEDIAKVTSRNPIRALGQAIG